jgi:hypothetical protein
VKLQTFVLGHRVKDGKVGMRCGTVWSRIFCHRSKSSRRVDRADEGSSPLRGVSHQLCSSTGEEGSNESYIRLTYRRQTLATDSPRKHDSFPLAFSEGEMPTTIAEGGGRDYMSSRLAGIGPATHQSRTQAQPVKQMTGTLVRRSEQRYEYGLQYE